MAKTISVMCVCGQNYLYSYTTEDQSHVRFVEKPTPDWNTITKIDNEDIINEVSLSRLCWLLTKIYFEVILKLKS